MHDILFLCVFYQIGQTEKRWWNFAYFTHSSFTLLHPDVYDI